MFDLELISAAARAAGREILAVYATDFNVDAKADSSPVTEADLRAHRVIMEHLERHEPRYPVLSEESSEQAAYEVRSQWKRFWMVDPLDGTKEFIKRNGQFTVNIALIEGDRAVAGVVYVPVRDTLYCTGEDGRAYRNTDGGEMVSLPEARERPESTLVVVGSRSHPTPELNAYVEEQREKYEAVEFISMGSSLKLCAVAEGRADVYPRFGPTMEWDTAAAHAVASAAGKSVVQANSGEPVVYNKRDLLNPWFIVR